MLKIKKGIIEMEQIFYHFRETVLVNTFIA